MSVPVGNKQSLFSLTWGHKRKVRGHINKFSVGASRRHCAPHLQIASDASGVRTCWPWETTATLPSVRQRKALRCPRGCKRGAGAYRGGRPLTACLVCVLHTNCLIMRPSSLGGGHILRCTLSVCPSVRPSRYRYRASRRAT